MAERAPRNAEFGGKGSFRRKLVAGLQMVDRDVFSYIFLHFQTELVKNFWHSKFPLYVISWDVRLKTPFLMIPSV